MDKKKIGINVAIIFAFIFSIYGVVMYYRLYNFSSVGSMENLHIVMFIIGIPSFIGITYILYTLRESIIFKTLLSFGIFMFLIELLNTFFGLYVLAERNSSFYLFAININIIMLLVLLVIALVRKERIITTIYVILMLVQVLVSRFGIIEYLLKTNRFDYYEGEIIVYYSFFQALLTLVIFIILLVIFNQDGIQFYENKRNESLVHSDNLTERKYNI